MSGEREATLRRISAMRDLAWRSRRLARTVPTPWMIEALTRYAGELDTLAAEMEHHVAASAAAQSD